MAREEKDAAMASDAADNGRTADLTSGRRDFRQEVTERMIRALDEGTPPWRKPWFSQGAFNGVTGREYHGGNRLYLRMVAQENGWDDPRWYTFNQAKQNEWGVRKGEKGHLVEYWKPPLSRNEARTQAEREKIKHPEIDVEKRAEELEKRGWRVFTAVVFNAAQIDAPVLDADKKPVMQTVVKPSGKEVQKPVMKPLSEVHPWTPASRKIDPIQRAEEIIAGIAPRTKYGADGAFYKSSTDTIHLPNRDTFRSAEEFYSTYLHEIGHWTGHESRLNREGIGAKFGSEAYAKEELRAELASVFLADETGIPLTDYHFQQHAAYIKSWAKELRENKHEIFAAARDAERIAEYVMAAAEERAALRDADLSEEKDALQREASRDLPLAVNMRETPVPVPAHLRDLCRAFNQQGVAYAVIGGTALALHGLEREARDIDVLVSLDEENMQRVAAALESLGEDSKVALSELARVAVHAPDLHERGLTTVYEVRAIPGVDVFGMVAGIGAYEDIAGVLVVEHEGEAVRVIDVGDLAASKAMMASSSAQDAKDASAMQALRERVRQSVRSGAVSSERFSVFMETYAMNLDIAVRTRPEEYTWPQSDLPKVLDRMADAVVRNSFNKDSWAFKQTCKELGIPHTYKAIDAYLERKKGLSSESLTAEQHEKVEQRAADDVRARGENIETLPGAQMHDALETAQRALEEEAVNRRGLPVRESADGEKSSQSEISEAVNFRGLPNGGNGALRTGWHHHGNGGGWVHDSASVASSAFVAQSASVGPNAIVEELARVEDNAVVYVAAHIEDRAVIGPEANVGERVIVGHAARVGGKAVLHDGVMIGSMAQIGKESVVRHNAVVMAGARIGENVEVRADAVIGDSAVVRYQSVIGDHARIGNGASIGNGVDIGNFTEVGHAASIGDHAKIGERMFIAAGSRVKPNAVLQRADDSASRRSFPLGDDGWMNMRALPRVLNDGASTAPVTAFESANQSFIVERGNGEQAYGFMQFLRAENALDEWRFAALQNVVLQRGGAFTAFQVARDFPEIADVPSLQQHAFEVLEALDGSKGVVMGAFVFASLPSTDVASLRRVVGERAADVTIVRAFDRFVETHRNGTPHVSGTNARSLPEPQKIALAAYHEALIPGADIAASQAIIERHGNSETAYRFARDIAGADISAMERVVIERGSALDAVKFVRDVPGVDAEMAARLEAFVAFQDAAFDTAWLADFNQARNERTEGANLRALPTGSELYDFGAGPEPAHRHVNGGGWVAETALVSGSAFVGPDVKVYGYAAIFGGVQVTENARVSGGLVGGSAVLRGDALTKDGDVIAEGTYASRRDIEIASSRREGVFTGVEMDVAPVNRRALPGDKYTAVERRDGLYDLYAARVESENDVRRADRYAYAGTGTREELLGEIERGLDVSILTNDGAVETMLVNARRVPDGEPPVEVVRGAMYVNAHDLRKWVLTSENAPGLRTVWDYDPVLRGETGRDATATRLYAYRNPETQRYSVVGADALAKLGDLIQRFDDGAHRNEQGHPLNGVAWGDLHSVWYNDAAVWEASEIDAVTMPLWWSPERQEVWMLPNRNIVQSLAVTVGTYPDAVRVTADLSNGEEQVVRDGVHADMPPPPPRAENANRRAFASQPGVDAASRRADVALNAASPSRYMMPRDVYREWAPIIEGVVERYYRMPQTQESLRMAAREMYDAAMRLPRLSADEAIDLSQDLTNQVLRGGVEEMDDPKGMALHNARRLLSDRADDIVLESARIARTERGVSFAMTLESTWRDVFEQRADLTYNVSTAMHRVTDQDVADFMDMTDFELGRIKSENLRAATKTVLLKTVAEPSLRGDIDRETALARLDQIAEAVIHYGDTLEATASAEDALAERIGANWRVEPQTKTAFEIWYYEDFEGGSGAYIGAHPVQFATAERAAEVAEDLARKSGLAWRFAVTECARIEDAMERPEPVNARVVPEIGDDEINARTSPNGQRFVRPAQADCDAQIESKSRYLYQHKDEIRSALEDAVSWREVESELAHLQVSVKFYASEKAQEQLARGERPHMGYVVVAQVGDREEVCPAYLFGERTSQPQVDKRLGPLTMSPLNLYRAKARSEQSSDATSAAEPKAEQRVNDVATNGAVAGVAKSRNVLPHITIEGGGESSFWQKVGEQFRDGVQRAADEVRDRRSREQILEDALNRFYTEKLPGGAIGYFMSEDALSPVFVDHGKRVDITVSPSQEGLTADERTAIRGAIALAAQKWGEVRITGTDPMFVRASVEIATDLGVEVKNHASLQAQLRAERDNSSTQPSGVSVANEADGVRDAHVSFGDQVREKFGLPPKAPMEAKEPETLEIARQQEEPTKEQYVVYSPSACDGAGGFYQYGENEGFHRDPADASKFDAPRSKTGVGEDARFVPLSEAQHLVESVNARQSVVERPPRTVGVKVHGEREDVTISGTFIGVRDGIAVLKDEHANFHGFREAQAFEDAKAGDVLRVQQRDGVVALDDLVSSNASQHHADVRYYDSAADAAGEL